MRVRVDPGDLDWLAPGIITQKVDANDLITNELIDEINRFDPAKIGAEAKAHKGH